MSTYLLWLLVFTPLLVVFNFSFIALRVSARHERLRCERLCRDARWISCLESIEFYQVSPASDFDVATDQAIDLTR